MGLKLSILKLFGFFSNGIILAILSLEGNILVVRDWFIRIVIGSTIDGIIAFNIFIEIPSLPLLDLGLNS